MNAFTVTFSLCTVIGFFSLSCTSVDSYRLRTSELQHISDSLEHQTKALEHEIEKNRSLWLQVRYEIEKTSNHILRHQMDSVVRVYGRFLRNYNRPLQADVQPYSDSPFLFPLNGAGNQIPKKVDIYWGRIFYFNYNHLGIDFWGQEGDSVRVIYDGIVKHYGSAGGYGELVAVVEHNYTSQWHSSQLPRKFLSIYGHIRNRGARSDTNYIRLQPGDLVPKGQLIGFINDDDHNGLGAEHLHLGIRLQSALQAKIVDGGKWMRGYDTRRGTKLAYFLDPIDLFGRYARFHF